MTKNQNEPHVYDANLSAQSDLQDFFERDSLVVATRFFRNQSLFQQLASIVLPKLVETGLVDRKILRVWSAGCSDGRETYSLAMACTRLLTELGMDHVKLNVRGSDLSRPQIKLAQKGIYKVNRQGVQRLERYRDFFETIDRDEIRIKEDIRSTTEFVVEDITEVVHPEPFDILVCSLVVLYYEPEFQRKIIQTLISSVQPNGFFHVAPVSRRWLETQGFVPTRSSGPFFNRANAQVLA